MKQEWWERPTCWLCDYWWAFLLALVLGLAAFFSRDRWMDVLGMRRPMPELGTGDIQVTLVWETPDDLDLWVVDPQGESIYYRNPTSSSGGELDVDANAGCEQNTTYQPVENIFWPTGVAPIGNYSVEVVYFENCGSFEPVDFQVVVTVDGDINHYSGTVENEEERIVITSINR
jgi:hypothetical protein